MPIKTGVSYKLNISVSLFDVKHFVWLTKFIVEPEISRKQYFVISTKRLLRLYEFAGFIDCDWIYVSGFNLLVLDEHVSTLLH